MKPSPMICNYVKGLMTRRQITQEELVATLNAWEELEIKHCRLVFRRRFPIYRPRRKQPFFSKEVEVLAVHERNYLLPVTVSARYH